MGQTQTVDSEVYYNALDQCDVDAIQNLLKDIKDPKPYLHQAVGSSTRLPIEIVTYAHASPERIIAALKLLIDRELDVNFITQGAVNPPFSLIAIDSSPEVIKFLIEKGMRFDGKAQYPAAAWCNYQVAHLIHNTPEPCSANNFKQSAGIPNYNHNQAKLKLDLFNFVGDIEKRKALVRLMEERLILDYNKVTGEYPEHNLTFELPTLNDKKVKCHVQYKTRLENNGSEDFKLTVKLQKSADYPDTMAELTAVYRVNAYDGNDTRPYTSSEGLRDMSSAVKDHFGIPETDFYGYLLLLVHHIDCGTLVAPRSCRKTLLRPPVLSAVPHPSWYNQVTQDWARAQEEPQDSESDDEEEHDVLY